MDLRMPVLDGIAATRRLRVEHPAVRVLALTTFDDDEEVFAALRAGAVGYLLKDVVVGPAGRGACWPPPAASRCCSRRWPRRWWPGSRTLPDATPRRRAPQPLVVPLSDRELDGAAAAGRRARATGRSPAALFLAEGTVKNHVTNVLAKLGARDRTQAALRARALGLL